MACRQRSPGANEVGRPAAIWAPGHSLMACLACCPVWALVMALHLPPQDPWSLSSQSFLHFMSFILAVAVHREHRHCWLLWAHRLSRA
jgi:hypothetical protein